MGLILCKTIESEKPFTINNMGQNIYSLEELAYYLYNNVYLIGSDIFDSNLLDFIKNDVKEEKLANNLKILIERKANLSEMVACVLRYVDYYTLEEVTEIKNILDSIGNKSRHERLCARADNLLKNKKYYSALKNYYLIIDDSRDEKLTDSFYAAVYHNMGVVYGRLFFYEKAYEYFNEADDLYKNSESEKQAATAAIMYKMQNGKELASLETEEEYAANHEIETLMNNAVLTEQYEQIEEIFDKAKNGDYTEYSDAIDELVESFQTEYRKITG